MVIICVRRRVSRGGGGCNAARAVQKRQQLWRTCGRRVLAMVRGGFTPGLVWKSLFHVEHIRGFSPSFKEAGHPTGLFCRKEHFPSLSRSFPLQIKRPIVR